MKPLGQKKTHTHVAGHQHCGICHPEQKRGRAASKREAAREIRREVSTPRQLRDTANGPWEE